MIIFESVTKQFGDNPPAVEDVSFSVGDGEFLFLTGHSGSGKTTLLKLLTKEYTPTRGEIEFDGQRLSKIRNSKVHHHRRKIGVIYQDYRLLPELNVWENIALALEIIGKPQREIEERVTDLLDLVQLSDKAYFFPAELSGGESQRVGIARALATAPNLLLADEPTGNLDPENTLMIARLFDKIHQLGTTVLFATHDLTVLETLGHRRLKLEKGKLVSDTPAKSTARKAVKKDATPSEKTEQVETKPEAKSEKTEKSTPKKEAVQDERTSKDERKESKSEKADKNKKAEEKNPPKKGRRFPSFHFSLFKRKEKKAEVKETKAEAPSKEKTEQVKDSGKPTSPSVDIKIEEL